MDQFAIKRLVLYSYILLCRKAVIRSIKIFEHKNLTSYIYIFKKIIQNIDKKMDRIWVKGLLVLKINHFHENFCENDFTENEGTLWSCR